MKRHFNPAALALALAAALSIPALLRGQTHPDLAGTWIVDEAKSDPAPPARGGGAGFGRGGGLPPNQMVIRQTDTELVVSTGNQNVYYNLDGSERTGPPGGETKSRIAWEGNKLVVTWRREFFAGPDKGYVTSTGRDVYTLDGTTLTVEKTSVMPQQAPQTRKIVYSKSS